MDQDLTEERQKGLQLARQIDDLTAERRAIELERDELTETLEGTKQELDEAGFGRFFLVFRRFVPSNGPFSGC